MSLIIKKSVNQIKNYFSKIDFIRGMVVLGSYARDELDKFSDIDLYLFGDNSNDWLLFENNPVKIFEKIFGCLPFINFIPKEEGNHNLKESLWIIYLPIGYIKIELRLYSKFDNKSPNGQFQLVLEENLISDAQNSILLDKNNEILDYAGRILKNKKKIDSTEKFEIEVRKFLNYFESFFTYFHRSDLYRAHLLHNLCFYKLSSLYYLSAGKSQFLYSLPNLTNKVLIGTAQNKRNLENLYKSSSTIDPNDMISKIWVLFDAFKSVLSETKIKHSISVDYIAQFKKLVLKKYTSSPPI